MHLRMGQPPRPSPLRPPAQVGAVPAAGCQVRFGGCKMVRCVGCKVVLTVRPGLTKFMCPRCQSPQMLPPELMRSSVRPPPPSEEVNEMGSRLDEEPDIIDSEINEYKEATYKLLKFRACKIRGRNGKFRCPFCVGKKNQDYEYTCLYQHAIRMAEGSEESAKQRANHFAMATYLVTDLADEAEPLPQITTPSPAAERDDDRTGFKIAKEFEKSSEACGRSRGECIDRRTSPGSSIYGRFGHDDDDKSDGPEGDYLRKKGALKRISDNYMHLLESETRKLLHIARDNIKGVLEEEEELLNLKLERRKQKLDSWIKELDKREAVIKRERQKLELEKTEKDLRNNQMAEKLREVEENNRRLVERLKEKEVASSNLKDVHQHSVLEERESNDELQEVRLELIKLLSDMPSRNHVAFGIKRMGEIDEKAFKDACKKRFPPGEAEIKAVELRIFWEKKLRENPCWQPFQIIEDDQGNPQGLVKRDDKQLQGLRDKWGEEIYNVVYAALIDLHKYRSGSYMDCELWNFRENRKATLMEVISYISTHLKTLNEESNMRKRLKRSRFVIKDEPPSFET